MKIELTSLLGRIPINIVERDSVSEPEWSIMRWHPSTVMSDSEIADKIRSIITADCQYRVFQLLDKDASVPVNALRMSAEMPFRFADACMDPIEPMIAIDTVKHAFNPDWLNAPLEAVFYAVFGPKHPAYHFCMIDSHSIASRFEPNEARFYMELKEWTPQPL